jgi:Antimicrobial peptide resistance and lipid A acylation protein PagP
MKISHPGTPALLALLLTVIAAPAWGGEFSAVLNGKSFHLGARQDWNEDNYGLGVEYQFASRSRWRTRLMANGFKDSNNEMSYMAGAGLHRNLLQTRHLDGFYIDAGINAFLMTRKDVNENRPFPGVLPSLTIGNRYVGVNLTYLPSKAVEKLYDRQMTDDSISGIVFLQFKISVNPRRSGD